MGTIILYVDRKEPFIRTGRVEGVGVTGLFFGSVDREARLRSRRSGGKATLLEGGPAISDSPACAVSWNRHVLGPSVSQALESADRPTSALF